MVDLIFGQWRMNVDAPSRFQNPKGSIYRIKQIFSPKVLVNNLAIQSVGEKMEASSPLLISWETWVRILKKTSQRCRYIGWWDGEIGRGKTGGQKDEGRVREDVSYVIRVLWYEYWCWRWKPDPRELISSSGADKRALSLLFIDQEKKATLKKNYVSDASSCS